MQRALAILMTSLLLVAGCGEDDASGPGEALEGVWDLVGYSEHGVTATASGTAAFGGDGNFSIAGVVTFPGEPPDPLAVGGTWSPTPDGVLLTTTEGTGEWTVRIAGTDATLTRVGPEPRSVIRLRRRTM